MELERNPVLLDLSFLTEEERRIIENVIKRDEALMNQTKERMKYERISAITVHCINAGI
jgi:hypothetical protein